MSNSDLKGKCVHSFNHFIRIGVENWRFAYSSSDRRFDCEGVEEGWLRIGVTEVEECWLGIGEIGIEEGWLRIGVTGVEEGWIGGIERIGVTGVGLGDDCLVGWIGDGFWIGGCCFLVCFYN